MSFHFLLRSGLTLVQSDSWEISSILDVVPCGQHLTVSGEISSVTARFLTVAVSASGYNSRVRTVFWSWGYLYVEPVLFQTTNDFEWKLVPFWVCPTIHATGSESWWSLCVLMSCLHHCVNGCHVFSADSQDWHTYTTSDDSTNLSWLIRGRYVAAWTFVLCACTKVFITLGPDIRYLCSQTFTADFSMPKYLLNQFITTVRDCSDNNWSSDTKALHSKDHYGSESYISSHSSFSTIQRKGSHNICSRIAMSCGFVILRSVLCSFFINIETRPIPLFPLNKDTKIIQSSNYCGRNLRIVMRLCCTRAQMSTKEIICDSVKLLGKTLTLFSCTSDLNQIRRVFYVFGSHSMNKFGDSVHA